MNHYAMHLTLTQYCKASILQIKKKANLTLYSQWWPVFCLIKIIYKWSGSKPFYDFSIKQLISDFFNLEDKKRQTRWSIVENVSV